MHLGSGVRGAPGAERVLLGGLVLLFLVAVGVGAEPRRAQDDVATGEVGRSAAAATNSHDSADRESASPEEQHTTPVYKVVGVSYGEHLNLRRTSSKDRGDKNIVSQIPAGARGLVPTGRLQGEWVEVRYEGDTGWVSSKFIEKCVEYDLKVLRFQKPRRGPAIPERQLREAPTEIVDWGKCPFECCKYDSPVITPCVMDTGSGLM